MFEREYISMVVICYASDTIEYDKGALELSIVPLLIHYIKCQQYIEIHS